MRKNLEGPEIAQFIDNGESANECFCNVCMEYMELLYKDPVGERAIIERWECPTCGDTYSIVKKNAIY